MARKVARPVEPAVLFGESEVERRRHAAGSSGEVQRRRSSEEARLGRAAARATSANGKCTPSRDEGRSDDLRQRGRRAQCRRRFRRAPKSTPRSAHRRGDAAGARRRRLGSATAVRRGEVRQPHGGGGGGERGGRDLGAGRGDGNTRGLRRRWHRAEAMAIGSRQSRRGTGGLTRARIEGGGGRRRVARRSDLLRGGERADRVRRSSRFAHARGTARAAASDAAVQTRGAAARKRRGGASARACRRTTPRVLLGGARPAGSKEKCRRAPFSRPARAWRSDGRAAAIASPSGIFSGLLIAGGGQWLQTVGDDAGAPSRRARERSRAAGLTNGTSGVQRTGSTCPRPENVDMAPMNGGARAPAAAQTPPRAASRPRANALAA